MRRTLHAVSPPVPAVLEVFSRVLVALLIAAGAVVGAVFVYQQNQERRVSQVEQGPRADFRVGAAASVMNHGGSMR